MLRPLALAAGFAWASSALLIPSTNVEIDQEVEAKAMALAGVMPQTLSPSIVLKLDCASCVLEDSEQEDGSGDNALLLNFTTSGDVLYLNDDQIYPTTMNFNHLRIPLIDADTALDALQKDPSSAVNVSNSRVATSYGIQSASSGTDASGHQTSTVTINLYALDQSPISVDEVHVKLVELSPAHILHLQSISTSPSPNSPTDPNPGNPTTGDDTTPAAICPTNMPAFLCQWRAAFARAMARLRFRKGCTGIPVTQLKGADNEDSPVDDAAAAVHLPTHIKGVPPANRFGSHGHPYPPHFHHQHHGHGHGHGQHHHGLHRFLRAAVRAFVGVLVPVLVGIVAGMAASIVGMAVGQLVALIVARVRGEHRAQRTTGYIVLTQEEGEGRTSSESEPLPQYVEKEVVETEAPPEYRDVAKVEEGEGEKREE
ncbi:MAG: hypothetical protein M1821_002976 [Bathelium mastoideum]|nr:MAG: hypothetical protein M1821_002976 [Bathelium mastoideum]